MLTRGWTLVTVRLVPKTSDILLQGKGTADGSVLGAHPPFPTTHPNPIEVRIRNVSIMQETQDCTRAPYVRAANELGALKPTVSGFWGMGFGGLGAHHSPSENKAFANVRFGTPEALGAIRHAVAQIAPLGFVG